MAVFCICGVCVPYNAIWPFLLLALRPLWDWLKKVLGIETKGSSADNLKNDTAAGGSCCSSGGDTCTKKKSGTFPQEHFDLTEADTLPAILADSALTVLKFTATWCKPCKKIEPVFDALSRSPEYASCANFVSVDVDEFDDVAASHSVVGVPVFVAYRGTKEHSRLQGSDKAELEAFLKAAAAF